MTVCDLKPADYNPRFINEKSLKGLDASIREFGCVQPIIVNKQTGNIVGGHQRYEVLRKNKVKETDVIVVDLPVEREKVLNIALNNHHIQGDWTANLGVLLEDIRVELPELYTDLNLDALVDDIPEIDIDPTVGNTDPDAIPDIVEEPVIKAGDLVVLGNHRLLCGDARKKEDVYHVMSKTKADMVFTDPPYNADYEGYTKARLKIDNDKMSSGEFMRFLTDVFVNYRSISKAGASLYVCHSSNYQREFQNTLEEAGFEIRCQIIWAKNNFAWGFGRYKFQHEPIFYAHVKGESDVWYGNKSQSTLWEENKPTANRLHPTMKPIELIERALKNSSKAGDIVCDLFGGSGSTLLACERTGRSCRMMELDPRYAQVIIERWINFTGKPEEVVVERNEEHYKWPDFSIPCLKKLIDVELDKSETLIENM